MSDEPDPPAKPKGGRPRVADPLIPVGTALRTKEYDQLIKAATAHETTVSALVRTWLRLKLKSR
jgi:hypothetical protein